MAKAQPVLDHQLGNAFEDNPFLNASNAIRLIDSA
jgi:hypothetical protein